ncbi:MAG TPA: hypothetical protein VEU33_31715, partial [Archangium sp.]|nr:hypothetical protein [Archangium sp.]
MDLALISGLPVSFVHDLYSPRYLRRPEVVVQTEAAAAPVIPEESYGASAEEPVMPALEQKPEPGVMMDALMLSGQDEDPHERHRRMQRRREALERTAAVKMLTKEVGDFFEYRVDHPVTVHRNQSALVPILHRPFEGRRVLLYNRATREKNPMACIELTNTTGLTLEGGPVTVTDGDTYVGEAMLDTMQPDDKRFVPYAVELGCTVSVDDTSEQGPVHRVVVTRGVLSAEFHVFRRTRYTLRNKAKRARTLYLEHPRGSTWTLREGQEPAETTDNFWRFKRELAAGASEEFFVTEYSQSQRNWFFSGTTPDEVLFLLESGFIDERVARAAREILSLRERAAQLGEEEKRLNTEREQLFKDQERIRANIESLKSGASQRDLAERFVAKLNEQEDRL